MSHKVGDKVTVKMNPLIFPVLCELNKYVLTVSRIIEEEDRTLYVLEWKQEDNPGKECDLPVNAITWFDKELTPYFNTPIAKIFYRKGLPDI